MGQFLIVNDSRIVYNTCVLVLFIFFIFEMCIIMMNLIIGLAISNIQDLKQNADGFRLGKEVLGLQRHMESLLGILNWKCRSQGKHTF